MSENSYLKHLNNCNKYFVMAILTVIQRFAPFTHGMWNKHLYNQACCHYQYTSLIKLQQKIIFCIDDKLFSSILFSCSRFVVTSPHYASG